MDFNKTVNLPKTDFAMRAGLPAREPGMLKRWEELDLYNELLKKNEGKPRFSLHDGPPFSNGNIHMGHALNKSLKDFIVRSYPELISFRMNWLDLLAVQGTLKSLLQKHQFFCAQLSL